MSSKRRIFAMTTALTLAPSGARAYTDDGTNISDAMFGAAFPYLTTPLPGAQ